MEKLKNIFLENKKAFLYGGIGLLSLIILIIVIIILVNVFRRYGPSQVESMMVEATKEYLSEHIEMTPTAESGPVTIEVNTLVEGKYLKDLSKLSTEEGCTGNVKVVFNNNTLRYIPELVCTNYETYSISETILSRETIVTDGNGLYEMNDYYTYRGEYVNNYVNFVNYSWRILKFNDEMMYLILSDTLNGDEMYVFDDRFNESINNYRGKNDFANSRVYLTLQGFYDGYFANHHAYLNTMDACVHTRSEQDQDKTGAIECYSTFKTPISLLSVYDYMNASLDPMCLIATSRNCSNYNYLSTTKNRWWLMNGTNENTYQVYASNSTGAIALDSASSRKDLRIVIAIPSEAIYQDGIGTSSDPFTFYEY